MPVVKLVNNPNRSMNPFKGQFLNQIYNHGSNVLKGRLPKEGKFVFTYYEQLIGLDDYVVNYFKEKMQSKKDDVIKWDFYEDLKSCFIYYRVKLQKGGLENELNAIWEELNLLAKRTDSFVEEKMKASHEQALKDESTYFEKVYLDAIKMNKELMLQSFFKKTMQLVSKWIQVVAKIRDLNIEVESKTTLQGLKYDIFKIQPKKSTLKVQSENIQQIKQKYIEYEKSLMKLELSKNGAFTETITETDDTLEVAYHTSFVPNKSDKQEIIKKAKIKKLMEKFSDFDETSSHFEIEKDVFISTDIFLSLTPSSVNELNVDDEFVFQQVKDLVNELSYYDSVSFTNSPEMTEELKKIQEENNKNIAVLYSENFGKIQSTADKNAYQIYQEMKANAYLMSKFLKKAEPILIDDTISFSFQNLQVTVEREDDWESLIEDNISSEREVEISNDTSTNPYKLTMMVKVVTVERPGQDKIHIVSSGKFKGFQLDPLVNVMGKFLGEGKSYSASKTGQMISTFETLKQSDGSLIINTDVLQEPYITWNNGKFVLGLPVNATNERSSLKRLKLKTNENGNYLFQANDYATIKDCLGSCLLSQKAHEELQKYFTRLEELEHSENEENLKKYSALALGGFNNDLTPEQSLALSWLDGNDLKGLCGVYDNYDKMLVGLGAIKLSLKKKASAKILIITSDRNVGDFKASMYANLKDADVVASATTEIGYSEFKQMLKDKFDFKKEYYAILIDKIGKEIETLEHPRKIFLTLKKTLENSPKEVYRLSLLGNNQKLDVEKENEFLNKYAINIGGKFVGVKPEISKAFGAWLKDNLHLMNDNVNTKDTITQIVIRDGQIYPETNNVYIFATMSKDITKAYREIAKSVHKQITDMQEAYLELEDTDAIRSEKEKAKYELSEKIDLLNQFNINPNKAMAKYLRMKGKPDQKFEQDNSKVISAVEQGIQFINDSKRVVYYTQDDDLAKETVISLSHKIKGKIHVLCLTNYIQFYQNGMPLKKGKVTRETNLQNFVLRTANPKSMTWANKTIKEFIIDNYQVATMVCNSSYTDFKLNKFKVLIHLDEGGWDNNIVMRRKLSGDFEQERFINSVYAEEGATEGDDIEIAITPKFYNEVVDKIIVGNVPVQFSEQVNVSDSTSISKFKRALMPTKKELSVIESVQKSKREDPIKNTTLDPNRFNHPVAKKILNFEPGRQEELKKMLDLTGFSGILNVASEHINVGDIDQSVNVTSKMLDLYFNKLTGSGTKSDWLDGLSRHIDDWDAMVVENKLFKTSSCAPNSLGNRALFTQLIAMKKEGATDLYTHGAGDFTQIDPETGIGKPSAFIGYYVWPKFGYNAPIGYQLNEFALKEYANHYIKARKSYFKDALPSQAIPQPVLQPLKLMHPGNPPVLENFDFKLKYLTSFYNDCTTDLIANFGNTPQYWKDQIDKYCYFKPRELDEEFAYAMKNRLVLHFMERHNNVFPYHEKNLLKPESIELGNGRFLDDKTSEYIYQKNSEILKLEDHNLDIWNDLIVKWAMKGHHQAMQKLNDISNGIFTDEDSKEELFSQALDEYYQKLDAYEKEEKQFQIRKREYEEKLIEYEKQEEMFNAFILPVDKITIQQAIQDKVFEQDQRFFLTSGSSWYLMSYARCAYYIQKKIEGGFKIDDILSLYEITFKDENGKTIKAGEEWWKLIGTGQDYTLNLDDKSKSFKKLNQYVKFKVAEAGYETLEEYLSSPVEPFDVDSLNCWLDFFREEILDHTTIEEKQMILKTYEENLKNAFKSRSLKVKTSKDLKLVLESALATIAEFEAKFNLKVPVVFDRKKTKVNLITRVARKKKASEKQYKTYEQMMYGIAEQDSDILTAISLSVNEQEKVLNLNKEIKELKGDLKP